MKRIILATIFLLAIGSQAFAIGPIMVAAHKVTCTATTQTIAKTNIYWSLAGTGGSCTSPTWSGTNEVSVSYDIGVTPYDLLTISALVNQTNYCIAASYSDAAGDESGMSNIVPFVVSIPSAPVGEKIQ